MDLILTGIGLLLMWPVWRFILKRSLLDTHRDRLFDLRDELRDKFQAERWDMAAPLYKQLRDLINGYLRHTEGFQYSEFMYIEISIQRNPELQAALKERFKQSFSAVPEEQMRYAMKLRAEARRVMMSHMIFSSFPLAFFTLGLFPFVALYLAICGIAKSISSTGASVFRSAVELHGLLSAFRKLVIAKIARMIIVEDHIEEFASRRALVLGRRQSDQLHA